MKWRAGLETKTRTTDHLVPSVNGRRGKLIIVGPYKDVARISLLIGSTCFCWRYLLPQERDRKKFDWMFCPLSPFTLFLEKNYSSERTFLKWKELAWWLSQTIYLITGKKKIKKIIYIKAANTLNFIYFLSFVSNFSFPIFLLFATWQKSKAPCQNHNVHMERK